MLQEGISGMASPEDMETMFELIYAYFTVPTVDSTAFNSFRKRIEGSIKTATHAPKRPTAMPYGGYDGFTPLQGASVVYGDARRDGYGEVDGNLSGALCRCE